MNKPTPLERALGALDESSGVDADRDALVAAAREELRVLRELAEAVDVSVRYWNATDAVESGVRRGKALAAYREWKAKQEGGR